MSRNSLQPRLDPKSHNFALTRRSFGLAAAAIAHSVAPRWAEALSAPVAVPVGPANIAYLMADRAERSTTLQDRIDETKGKVKRFWVQNWREPEESFAWTIKVQPRERTRSH